MTNPFMAEYYANEKQAIAAAQKQKNNLVTCYTERMANFKPTPTVAEMATVANGGAVTLAGSAISGATIMRPGPAELSMQRKCPIRT